MSQILFFIEDVDFVIDLQMERINWISKSIQAENKSLGDLNVIICSDDYLIKMNRQYLDHDYYTDIITFDNSTGDENISGDLFISIDRVKDNAKSVGVTADNELDRVIIHGVLHLIGYNDKTDDEIMQMRKKEEAYLSLRGY